jgi:hypothetical protein
MTVVTVDGLTFTFPTLGWAASKYDEWSFYRNQFGGMRDGIKAVDLIAVEASNKTAWFVEVKDYRMNPRTKPTGLAEEVAHKVFDTLAALLPARANANDATEQQFAGTVLSATKLRVVLHLEQPQKHSTLRPRAINPSDVAQQLKRLLKPIDAHPLVVEKSALHKLAWTVK